MAEKLLFDEHSRNWAPRSRFRMTFDYRLVCTRCGQPKLMGSVDDDRQVFCAGCSYVYPSNSFSASAISTLCDDCGFAAMLMNCGQARLCVPCAKKWDEAGRKTVVVPDRGYHRAFVAQSLLTQGHPFNAVKRSEPRTVDSDPRTE